MLLIRVTAVFLCAFFAFQPQTGAQPGALVILHITVIDATGRPPQNDLAVLISQGKIERIAKADQLEIPKNAQILDGTGKYLIPGLWDSHVHLTMATDQEGTRELLAPLLVAYGVTTVREMGGAMRRSRVTLLAGTDAIDGFTLPGPSLHDELALMVEAGLSPMEALQTATRNPGEFLDRSNRLGRILKGGVADLVVLDANPLQNIANTRKIHAIIIGGKLISQTQRQEMLARLEAFAQQH